MALSNVLDSYLHVLVRVLTPLLTVGQLCPSGCPGLTEAQLGSPSAETGPRWPSPGRAAPRPHSRRQS